MIRQKESLKGVAEVAKRVKAVGADWKDKGITYVEALKALADYGTVL